LQTKEATSLPQINRISIGLLLRAQRPKPLFDVRQPDFSAMHLSNVLSVRWKMSWLALVWLAGMPALGQFAYQPATAGLYDGQTVEALSVVADPHLDVERLKSLVKLQPGTKFSDKEVQASIAALKQEGKFTSVQLEVTPKPEGLRLTFVLEPAYYIGMVTFPGADKHFTYTRLLQVVNFPDQTPYDKAGLPAATGELADFLHSQGYFQATVHANAQLDDAHKLANISFHVEPGKRAHIGKVSIEGPTPQEDTKLLRAVHSWRSFFTKAELKPGKSYSPGRIRRAIATMRRSLAGQRRLASTVKQNSPRYNPQTNRADISFHVEVGPEVDIKVTGARLSIIPFMSGREKEKLIPIYSEASVDRDLVQEGQSNLVNYFQKKGYFDVKVNIDFHRQPDKILLTYNIEKGKRHKLSSIAFHGNHHLDSTQLLPQLTIKKAHFWFWSHGEISQRELQKSEKNLESRYRDAGFEGVSVTSDVVDHEPDIYVTFNIDEGPRTLVGDVKIEGNDHISLAELMGGKQPEVVSGEPFSPRQLSNDRSRIAATYLNQGFLNAEVKTRVQRNPDDGHLLDVIYQVSEGQRVRIAQVVDLGLDDTRPKLVQKTTNLAAGEPMSQGRMLQAETDLYDLGIFDWASVAPRKPITTQKSEETLVKVHEEKRNEITYGFGLEISHRGGNVPAGTIAVPGLPPVGIGNHQIAPSEATFVSPRGSIEFTRHNIFGMAHTGAISLVVARLDQRMLSTYGDPHFLGSQWKSLASISLERTTENPLFGATLGDASFQVERQISRRTNTRLQVRYDFNRTYLSHLLVPELVLQRDRNLRLSTLSGTLIRDTRDQPLDAHRGIFSTIDLALTPVRLGSSATFAKLYGQYAFYKPVHSMVWANSVRVGLAKAFGGSFVPTSQLFFSGGGTSLRGFPLNEAGPQRIVPFCGVLSGTSDCVNVTVPVGGRQLFILNSELRFPLHLMKNLGGVVFYDGGNVYQAINLRSFVNDYTNTVGIGFRYSTPVGPIRIDIGRNLNPVPGIKATQFFITLGQAF
jgi:outer membrane protein insertion porin family